MSRPVPRSVSASFIDNRYQNDQRNIDPRGNINNLNSKSNPTGRFMNNEENHYPTDDDYFIVPPFNNPKSSSINAESIIVPPRRYPPPPAIPPFNPQQKRPNLLNDSQTMSRLSDNKQQSSEIVLQKSYLYSLDGFVRLGIILCLFFGWIASLSIIRVIAGPVQISIPPGMASTRLAYIFFGISNILISIAIYIINLLNIRTTQKFMENMPWLLIVTNGFFFCLF
jgi:hypothetical protein